MLYVFLVKLQNELLKIFGQKRHSYVYYITISAYHMCYSEERVAGIDWGSSCDSARVTQLFEIQ